MPSHSNQDSINFLYVSHTQNRKKRRRPSFWGCRPRKPTSAARERNPRDKPADAIEPSSRSEAAQAPSPRPPARQVHQSPVPPSPRSLAAEYHNMDRPPPTTHDQFFSPVPQSSAQARAPSPVMQPFRALVTSVRRCPWAPVSDLSQRNQYASDDAYYPPVPRSLLHDTAVSFVVRDHTRPDLPEFVISCPFENVHLVHQLLAPDGSRRQLTARGTSGQPRSGDQLRSMLLDGTPSIELALHADPGQGVIRPPQVNQNHSRPGGDGGAEGRRAPMFAAPVTPRREDANTSRAQDAFRRPPMFAAPVTPRREDANTSRLQHDFRNMPRWGPPLNWNAGQLNNSGRGQHTSSMNGHTGRPEAPVADYQIRDFSVVGEPEVENPRTSAALASPLWMATPLRAPSTPPSSTPTPSYASEHSGTALGYISPSPLHFQATVESAPPTPSTGPVKVDQDEPVAISLEEGQGEGGDEGPVEGNGDTGQEGPGGGVGEPPALVYVQPSPGQLESGVPLTGWLCDPEWLRRRLREFTLGNTQGN